MLGSGQAIVLPKAYRNIKVVCAFHSRTQTFEAGGEPAATRIYLLNTISTPCLSR